MCKWLTGSWSLFSGFTCLAVVQTKQIWLQSDKKYHAKKKKWPQNQEQCCELKYVTSWVQSYSIKQNLNHIL